MKKIIIFTIVVLFCGITSTMCWAQTSTSFPGSTGSSNSQNNQQNIAGNPQLMIPIIIGTMLRASDRHIRLEALQSMVAVLGQSQGNTNNNSTNNTSIAGLFSINNQNNTSNNNNNNNNNNTSTGSTLGGAVFLPDLYTLLDDPDQ